MFRLLYMVFRMSHKKNIQYVKMKLFAIYVVFQFILHRVEKNYYNIIIYEIR